MDTQRLNELAHLAQSQVKREYKDAIIRQKEIISSSENLDTLNSSDSEMLRLLLEKVDNEKVRERVIAVVLNRVAEPVERGPETTARELIHGLMSSFIGGMNRYEARYKTFPAHRDIMNAAFTDLQVLLRPAIDLYDLGFEKIGELEDYLTPKQKEDFAKLQEFLHDDIVERFLLAIPAKLPSEDAGQLLAIVVSKAKSLKDSLIAKPAPIELPPSKAEEKPKPKFPEKRSTSRRYTR